MGGCGGVCVVMGGRCGVWEGVVVCVVCGCGGVCGVWEEGVVVCVVCGRVWWCVWCVGGRCGVWEEGGRVCVVNFTCRPRIKSHCKQPIRAVKM